MKLYRLVYVSKTAKTVWYYTGRGMTATDGGWSQYENDALTVEKDKKALLQVMRSGGPRVTGNSLDDHYFLEERDDDSAWDWTQHTQPAGVEYNDCQQAPKSGQLDLFALQPDQVADGWVNDRPSRRFPPDLSSFPPPLSLTSLIAIFSAEQVADHPAHKAEHRQYPPVVHPRRPDDAHRSGGVFPHPVSGRNQRAFA